MPNGGDPLRPHVVQAAVGARRRDPEHRAVLEDHLVDLDLPAVRQLVGAFEFRVLERAELLQPLLDRGDLLLADAAQVGSHQLRRAFAFCIGLEDPDDLVLELTLPGKHRNGAETEDDGDEKSDGLELHDCLPFFQTSVSAQISCPPYVNEAPYGTSKIP